MHQCGMGLSCSHVLPQLICYCSGGVSSTFSPAMPVASLTEDRLPDLSGGVEGFRGAIPGIRPDHMALVTGAYGMKDFSSVLGRIAQISFLVFLVVFVAAVLLQV